MNKLAGAPAWPRRPPLWSSAALFLSLGLGLLYGWATVKLMPGNQGQFFPVYAKSAVWSLVPQMPTFGKRRATLTHLFSMPDGSTVDIPAKALYLNLQSVIYQNRSILGLFRTAFVS